MFAQMCQGLQTLNLSTSNIGDDGVTYLMEALMENEELRQLVGDNDESLDITHVYKTKAKYW